MSNRYGAILPEVDHGLTASLYMECFLASSPSGCLEEAVGKSSALVFVLKGVRSPEHLLLLYVSAVL